MWLFRQVGCEATRESKKTTEQVYTNGNVRVKQVPSPSVLSTLIVPAKDSTSFFVMKRPSPVPLPVFLVV